MGGSRWQRRLAILRSGPRCGFFCPPSPSPVVVSGLKTCCNRGSLLKSTAVQALGFYAQSRFDFSQGYTMKPGSKYLKWRARRGRQPFRSSTGERKHRRTRHHGPVDQYVGGSLLYILWRVEAGGGASSWGRHGGTHARPWSSPLNMTTVSHV